MKKLLAVLLVLVMCFTMAACSTKKSDKDDDDKTPGASDPSGSASAVGGDAVDTVVGVYDALLGSLSGNGSFSASGELSVYLSDDALNLLEQAIFGGSTGMDLKWINNVTVGVDMAQKNDLMSMAMDLGLSKTKIVSLEILMDMASGKLFMGLPELSDKYLGGAIGGASDAPATEGSGVVPPTQAVTPVWMQMFTEHGSEFLPDAETFGKLLDKYIDVALNSITMPEKQSVELTVSGVTKTVSRQRLVINQKLIAAVCTAVLTEAKTDADIKAILENFEKLAVEEYGAHEMNLHGEFVEMIDEMLAEIAGDTTMSEAELGSVTLYTDGDALAGIAIDVTSQGETQEVFSCITLNTADKTGTKLNAANRFAIEGSGSLTGGKLSGTYMVSVGNTALLSVELKDCVENGANVSGTVRIFPEDGLYDMMGSQVSSALSVVDFGLEFIFNSTANSGEVTINILRETTVYAGVTIKTSIGTNANVTLPSDSQVVDMQDRTALESWVSSLDLNKIVDNLRKGGLPSQLVEALETALQYMSLPSGDFDDYDDYYGGYGDIAFEAA